MRVRPPPRAPPDHFCSLEPTELKVMVRAIRNIENSFGNGIKEPTSIENKNKKIIRKSIVASRDIEKNEVFSENNLTCKRPGNGISPMEWDNLMGTKAKQKFYRDDLIII